MNQKGRGEGVLGAACSDAMDTHLRCLLLCDAVVEFPDHAGAH